MPIILPTEISERLLLRTFTYEDTKIIIEKINSGTYFDFYDFMKKYTSMQYNLFVSLQSWFTQITKKCNSCNFPVEISKKNSEIIYYKCSKCKIIYSYYIYDIDEYVVSKFMYLLQNN